MNFHTISKLIDNRKPNQSVEYNKMMGVTKKRITGFVKYDKRFDDLSYQQTFDLMEGYAYAKKGSNTALFKILELLKHHFDSN